jgi:hypothetical protein
MASTLGQRQLLASVLALLATVCSLFLNPVAAQDPAGLQQARGVRVNSEAAAPGYVMFSPIISGITYLINNDGQVVHTWMSEYGTGHGAYLRDNGNLIRQGRVVERGNFAGGQGGQIQEFTWDGELVWDYRLANEQYLLHHDAALLPNGNILAIAWEFKSAEEARAAGRRPDVLGDVGLWPEVILELEPRGRNDADIVWVWRGWDHAIQDFDPNADNYGVLADHPELSDINSDAPNKSDAELAELRVSTDVALLSAEDGPGAADIMHFNGIAYNAELDQIIVSVHDFHEFFVLDHSTTTAEAAGSTGGRYGMGGDILYRWGNAGNYNRGGSRPQTLFGQHDARWIEAGDPGAGNITVFNNNFPGASGTHSVAFELEPPINSDGSYRLQDDGQYGPSYPVWSYMAPDGKSFHAPFISGAQRLANGHTFITSGPQGRFFEVTSKGDVVWEYWSPYSGEASLPHHEFLVEDNAPNLYSSFRALKISPDHPALSGRDLSPLVPQPPAIPHVVLD